jgi:hypothetical protein
VKIANAIAQEEGKKQTARNVAKAVTSIKKPKTSQDTQAAQEISPWDTSPQALITTLKGNQGQVVFSHHPNAYTVNFFEAPLQTSKLFFSYFTYCLANEPPPLAYDAPKNSLLWGNDLLNYILIQNIEGVGNAS